MEKKHDLLFCPQCGAKLDGDEILCPSCGYKLAEINPINKTTAPVVPPPVTVPKPPVPPPTPPPSVVPPVIPPVVIPPANYQKPLPGFIPKKPKKKGLGIGWLIIIIVIGLIVLGGGTVAFLQYNGNIDVAALRNIIPAKENSDKINVSDPTRYYVVQSFAIVDSRWTAIVSDIVVSKLPYNNEEGAKNHFKKAIMIKYPAIWNLFADNIIVHKYNSLTEAENAHSSLIMSYDARKYNINTINFGY
jgi:hypothetical protein